MVVERAVVVVAVDVENSILFTKVIWGDLVMRLRSDFVKDACACKVLWLMCIRCLW